MNFGLTIEQLKVQREGGASAKLWHSSAFIINGSEAKKNKFQISHIHIKTNYLSGPTLP